MNIDDKLLDKLSALARIRLPDSERASMKTHLSKVLTWMEKLNELDTSEVPPLINMSDEKNASRTDTPGPHLDKSSVLDNAPDKERGYIRVPQVK